jgi:transforming growth factor-beta-induced protein
MKKQTLILGMAALTGISVLTSCEKEESPMLASDMTIAQYAVSDKNFSILVDALSRADLVDALNGEGNFTVFAPTNAAFTGLLNELGLNSVNEIPLQTLKSVLLYHVLGEEKKSSMLSEGYYNTISPSFNGFMSLKVGMTGGVKINNTASVTVADVDVKNGVIHVINEVLLPPTVVDLAAGNENFSILVQAVVKAGLVETLNGSGPFTIFAPTNAAFQELFTTIGVSGISDLTAEQLIPILTYHVVSGNVRSTDLSAGTVETLNGSITIALSPAPSINGTSAIVATDVQGANGVIHVIDEVLLPSK